MAVYGYTRVSSREQAEDDRASLPAQRRDVEAIAQIARLPLDRLFEEPGVSGGRPLAERPSGSELVSLLRPGDTVIVAKLDRAFRSAADAMGTAAKWKREGVDLIVAQFGPGSLMENGASRMFLGMLALVAEFERECIRERTDEGRKAKRARGGHIGGTAPFGFRVVGKGAGAHLEPIPEQQAALATVRELAAARASSRAIAAAVRAKHGVTVSHVAVLGALKRTAELLA